jgi:hypothetical protein
MEEQHNATKTRSISFQIPDSLFCEFKVYAVRNRIPVKSVLARLVKDFLNEQTAGCKKSVK